MNDLKGSIIPIDYIENLINTISDTLVVVSPTGTIQKSNSVLCGLLGYTAEELHGEPLSTILSEQSLEKDGPVNEILKNRSKNRVEKMYLTKEGDKTPVLFSAFAIYDNSGKTEGMVCVGQDISKLEKMRTELTNKAMQVELANTEKEKITGCLIQSDKLTSLGELTAGIAHEMNQPLNGIKIIVQSVLRDIEREKFEEECLKDDLLDVVDQVNKMAEIIRHITLFSRKTEGSENELIEINKVVEGPCKLLGQQFKNHNINIIKELDRELPKIRGNAVSLEQVVINLMTNAKKSVENFCEGEKKIWLKTLLLDKEESGLGLQAVAVEVKDNGGGLSEEMKSKVFKPFFTTAEKGKGTGLGLSVSRKIVDEHKGRIEIVSMPGEGAAFRVIIPVAS